MAESILHLANLPKQAYNSSHMKYAIGILIFIILAGLGGYLWWQSTSNNAPIAPETEEPEVVTIATTTLTDLATTTDEMTGGNEKETVLGASAKNNNITAYHFGTGDTELLFVGGIHGGYSWNTALVAYELIDYLEENPDKVPENVRVTVVPVMNPDGLMEKTGKTGRFSKADVATGEGAPLGRFNGNNVDLNRNFDCDWNTKGTWQQQEVSGGSAPFSEPESKAVRDYIEKSNPTAVVVWYSSAGGVFSSSCHNGVAEETREITNVYAKASGYKAFEEFDFYEITGDMVNWLAKNNVPAISVLLTTHEAVEWEKNRAGIDALLGHYAEEKTEE